MWTIICGGHWDRDVSKYVCGNAFEVLQNFSCKNSHVVGVNRSRSVTESSVMIHPYNWAIADVLFEKKPLVVDLSYNKLSQYHGIFLI